MRARDLLPRPWGTVWGLRDSENRPWRRPLNDEEMVKKGPSLVDYKTADETGEGRWEWP